MDVISKLKAPKNYSSGNMQVFSTEQANKDSFALITNEEPKILM